MNLKNKLVKCFFALAIGLFITALEGSALAQTWVELATVGGPSGDSFHGFIGATVTYDAGSNRLIVFLPTSSGCHGPAGLNGEVWVLTNANGLGGSPVWSQLVTSGSPPPAIHYDSTAVYDGSTNQLIVYGGGFCHTSPALNGVFVLTNANGLGGTPTWSLVSVTNAPCSSIAQPGSCTGAHSRLEHSAVYDSATGRMNVFGGHLAFFGTDQNDSRVLPAGSPSTWITLAPAGAPPPIRSSHSAVYDAASNRMIVYAGQNLVKNFCCGFPFGNMVDDYGDLWILTGANGTGASAWLPQTPAGGPPPDRAHHSAVYDSANNRMLVFGGVNVVNFTAQTTMVLGDLWSLSNANGLTGTPTWTPLAQLGTPPGPLSLHGAAFDVSNQRMMVMAAVPDLSGTPVTRVWILSFNNAPTAICQNVTVSAGPNCTANASIDNGSFDPDGSDTITLSQSPAGPYPLGTTSVTLTVTDNHGASNQCVANVTVVDDTPPAITGASANPSSLWPPNHKMIDVVINYSVSENCDSSPACVLSVTSNEPVDGTGDGDTSPDWEVIDAHHVRLRAERAGGGNGRVYTITITCTDAANNSSTATVTVSVPHAQK